MWKTVLAGTTALVVVGSTFVYAQQSPGTPDVPRAQESDRSAQDRDAFLEARIAALRAGLMLTPEQARNWPAFEEATRTMAKLHAERWRERGTARPADPIERLQQRADDLTRRGAALKRLADAAGPLYQSLDEAQKRRFFALARPLSSARGFGPGPHGMMGHGMHGMMGHGMMGPGWGRRGDDRDDARRREEGYHGYGRGMGPYHWRGERGDERGRHGMGPRMGGPGWYHHDRSESDRSQGGARREFPRQEEEERL